jgi:hypothetical protein
LRYKAHEQGGEIAMVVGGIDHFRPEWCAQAPVVVRCPACRGTPVQLDPVLHDVRCLAQQLLGLGVATRGLEQARKIAEKVSQVTIRLASEPRRLGSGDRQCPAIEGFCLGIAASVRKGVCKEGERIVEEEMVLGKNREGLPIEPQGLGFATIQRLEAACKGDHGNSDIGMPIGQGGLMYRQDLSPERGRLGVPLCPAPGIAVIGQLEEKCRMLQTMGVVGIRPRATPGHVIRDLLVMDRIHGHVFEPGPLRPQGFRGQAAVDQEIELGERTFI